MGFKEGTTHDTESFKEKRAHTQAKSKTSAESTKQFIRKAKYNNP
jgi:hypothetical protein